MRRLLASMGCLLMRAAGTLLRRRSWSGALLLLLGAAVCLFYQTLVLARNRSPVQSDPQEPGSRMPTDAEVRRWICDLEALQRETQVPAGSQRAVVLTGHLPPSHPEVQLYHRVLRQLDHRVHLSRYAETSSLLRGVDGWSLLLCLSGAERSCLRRVSFSHLQRHQMVNILPSLIEAFSDAGGGQCVLTARSQPAGAGVSMRPHSCGSTNQKLHIPQDSNLPDQAPPPALVAQMNVYVLVTSVTPLTSFLHDTSVVTTNQQPAARPVKLRDFLLEQFGPATSHDALGQVKRVISEVLQAAASGEERCVSCFQLLTFVLLFRHSAAPVIVKVDTELTFSSLSDAAFERQITRDRILEDTLHFVLTSHTRLSPDTHLSPEDERQRDLGVGLSDDHFLLLLRLQQQLRTPSAFTLLYVPSSSSLLPPRSLSDLILCLARHYDSHTDSSCGTKDEMEELTDQQPPVPPPPPLDEGVCSDPHLRQIYTDPVLTLTPPFSPEVKAYRAEVSFDTVTVRIRPEPLDAGCRVHLDEHRGPRMANYPLGLGDSRISILMMDNSDPDQPVVMTIYTILVSRESRPSLPMFGEHVTCSFLQDCGLVVQPGVPCGLQPHIRSLGPVQTCSSGHVPGRWVVPCLSCSDNRTCDWREVAWQPDGCSHLVVDRPLLQDCMRDRKVLFIGDSTNRGMMYFLMERVNSSLEDWGKAHDTLIYKNLNGGRTLVGYSYYPQFWLEKKKRPTFRQALLQLLHRSRPLMNSNLTVLVVGGVQWLKLDHLRTVKEVLDRESLNNITVVVKSLGMGFHLPVDGIRSLTLTEIQALYHDNSNIINTAEHHGYEAIDTFSMTMGRYKEFLQGRCACHFHEVEKFWSPKDPMQSRFATNGTRPEPGLSSQPDGPNTEQEVGSRTPHYHVRGLVNQVYSEILLSRLCPRTVA